MGVGLTILFCRKSSGAAFGKNLQPLQIHLQPFRMNLLPFQFEGKPFGNSLPAVGPSEVDTVFAGTTFVLMEINAMGFF